MITNLTLDGIPLASKYLKILGDGLANNRNLRSLSLARCRIGDTGWLKFEIKYLNLSNNQIRYYIYIFQV